MSRLPRFVRFFLKFFLIYFGLLLLVNFTGVRKHFLQWFAESASSRFENYIPQAKASFEPNEHLGEHDMNIVFVNTRTYGEKIAAARAAGVEQVNLDISASPFSTWDYFLLPFIILIALVLAWSQPPGQKLRSFLTGGIVLFLFIWLRFHCTLWFLADHSENLEPLRLGPVRQSLIDGLHEMQSIEFIFISTFMIWAMTTLKRKDIQGLITGRMA